MALNWDTFFAISSTGLMKNSIPRKPKARVSDDLNLSRKFTFPCRVRYFPSLALYAS
jgi:hypothetical protein